MPARKDIHKILIIGSGPIIIGQACEFDYSGTQAVKALKSEGYEVILVNPNPATVMTTPGIADRIYVEPLTVKYVTEIIRKERPDAVLSTMGGQTALNLTLDLAEEGVLEKYGVEVIGAKIESIFKAEDRGEFKKVVESLGLESPRSIVTKTVAGALKLEKEVGLPLVIRPSFTLGGMGGSIAYDHDELKNLVERALLASPVGEALIEESLIGWKEFEMEVMRDKMDNAIIVCSIENIDPMGVHTGDSITIAPIQTLDDRAFQKMRNASIDILRAIGVDCGGSNVQFAVKPDTGRMIIIEMNPRVSRSSALASKATGFPIAHCSAKLAVGFTLDEVTNEITGKTASCFEPALDYCAVKVPRFETEKFPTGYSALGTQMKSVGEALALGRTALEALNKAIRASETGFDGMSELRVSEQELETILTTAHPRRLLGAYTWIKWNPKGSLEDLAEKTGFNTWFLYQLQKQVKLENRIAAAAELDKELMLEAKKTGLSDSRIGELRSETALSITTLREKQGLEACFHFVDSCAGEINAQTPYFYSTWGEIDEGSPTGDEGVIILASGPNRIGQGLEFDTCCTLASISLREQGVKTIMINSNPETVSTDFNISDRLYLEPLTSESVKQIMKKEEVKKIVVQLGGQTPLNMVEELEKAGALVVGTSVANINKAEDRKLFSEAMAKLGLKQPRNKSAYAREELAQFSREIGFPVLLRPSFVLGGRSMFIAYSVEELDIFLSKGIPISPERPVLVDQFLEDAFEYDLDAVSDGKNVYVGGIMQHIEAAGIHSGDSACVFPPYKSTPEIVKEMSDAAVSIAREFNIQGFLNIQFAVKEGIMYILEVNPRASRTIPFLSKTSGVNLIEAAVKVWNGTDLMKQGLVDKSTGVGEGSCQTGWAVKEAVFSFDRFAGLDPILGPEMKSTGEAIGIGDSYGEAFAKVQAAVGCFLPTKGRVFVTVSDKDKQTILPIVKDLVELGFEIAATRGTADFLYKNGIFSEVILKLHQGHPSVVDHMSSGRIDMLINTPLGRFSQIEDEEIRTEAVRRKIPYTTTTSAAQAAVIGIKYLKSENVNSQPLP
ncbi:carbamoyl-phosphate synthase large subunit [Oceanispirochaeta sp.]|jgi:carbamoyl-phosphate synthase large subunit|uniref:carbamoyl-phosphate synthase large subunit n=1 Tax=Oceanispirochaeta sp. TaxID=2035350 RepID=UPI00261C7D08|nr:carbamoyl-phosphate synthase large subunit [Oceanispirochaeta sp.]MDA3955319.1 carbamoyl-phosphate synthase large subunit [Oceanispirochaeta sp.]